MSNSSSSSAHAFDWQLALKHWSTDEMLIKQLAHYISVYGVPGLCDEWLNVTTLEELRRPVHTLRGVSALFGFAELNEFCASFESQIVSADSTLCVADFSSQMSTLSDLLSKSVDVAETALTDHF